RAPPRVRARFFTPSSPQELSVANTSRISSIFSAALFGFVSLASFAAVGATSAGCKSSSDDSRKSQKGEVCETTNDCASSLSCVPRAGTAAGGICVEGEFKVSPTAKECAVIQCQQSTDCC